MNIVKRLQAAQASKDHSGRQAALNIGVSPTGYRLWILGAAIPTDNELLRKIADYCACDFDDVLHDIGFLRCNERVVTLDGSNGKRSLLRQPADLELRPTG